MDWKDLYRLTQALGAHFVASYPEPPAAIVLDLDHTDDPTHGQQEFAFYNYYTRAIATCLYSSSKDSPVHWSSPPPSCTRPPGRENAMPLTQLFPHVPLAAWDPHRQRYPEVFPRPDTWRPHFGGFLLRSQGRTILVDTGMGSTVINPGAVAMFTGGADGHLLEELQAVGCAPRTSTPCSPAHPARPRRLESASGRRPGAGHLSQGALSHTRADWEAFKSPEVQGHFRSVLGGDPWSPGKPGGPGAPGGRTGADERDHGHPDAGPHPRLMGLAIVSGGQRALIIGDVTVNPAQVAEPDWVFAFDMDPVQAVQTRKHMIERAETEDAL